MIAFGVLMFVGLANMIEMHRVGRIRIPRISFLDWCVLAAALAVVFSLVAPATIQK
jgi:hypothetical protein